MEHLDDHDVIGGPTEAWRRRAEQAEAALRQLRQRFLSLAVVLPPEYLHYLDVDTPALEEAVGVADLFLGWEDTPILTPSHICDEMEGLWKRMPTRDDR